MGIRVLVSPRGSLGVLKLKFFVWFVCKYMDIYIYIHPAYACTVQQYYIFVVQPFFLEIIESDK